MTKTRAQIVAIMRARGITVAMISDENLDILIDDAVTLYTQYRPDLAFAAITTIADTAVYPLPAGGIHLREGVYDPSLSSVDPTYNELLTYLLTYEPGAPEFHLPSQMTVWRQKIHEWAAQFGGTIRELEDGSIQINPTPETTGDLAVILYTKAYTFDTLPDGDEGLFLEILRLLCREAIELGAMFGDGAGVAKRLGAFSYDDRAKVAAAGGFSKLTQDLRNRIVERLAGPGYGMRG